MPAENLTENSATIPGWAVETVTHFATQLALGAAQADGVPSQLGSMQFVFEAARPGENAPAAASDAHRMLRRVS